MGKKESHAIHMVPITTTQQYHSSELLSPNNTMRQRGLLDSSPTLKGNILNSPFQFSSTKKRWRWWDYMAVLFAIIAFTEMTALIINAVLLTYASEPVTFTIQNYPKIPYQQLDTTVPINLAPDSTVYHVTKEFGLATMGGMGMVLTAITQAQLQTGKITPYVVLPFYSFLKKQEQYPTRKTVDLVITIRNDNGELEPAEFKVSELQYDFNPIDNFESLPDEEKLAIIKASRSSSKKVKVYLIGPSKGGLLHKAFRANSITQIYSSPKGLPQEWKDQYFDKAVASFLTWKAAGKHEQSLFDPLNVSQPRVDIVHLHGATNAYVAKYLKEYEKQSGPTPPSIVYTMHDYLDELQYTNTLENVERFLNAPRTGRTLKQEADVLAPYTFGKEKVFMSPLAIDMADIVTFVSQSMAKDMVEGRLDFYLKEVVMENLLRKAEISQFYGISNGLDFSGGVNPFTETKLIEHTLNYPSYAKLLIDTKLEIDVKLDKPTTNHWTLSSQNIDYVTDSKLRAKEYLITQGILKYSDLDRPLVLFVGRFQYNKGLETFEEATRLFKLHNMKFAIIGQPNNYPLKWVQKLADNHPDDIVLMTHTNEQRDWLIYFRAAADFVYVPSITESFGLVAAEGLLFGSSVISTGTGGMGEFLVDRQVDDYTPAVFVSDSYIESNYRFNAYIFDSSAKIGNNQLSNAIQRAAKDYARIKKIPALHEEYVLRIMASAYALGWDRGNNQGPVYDYLRVYQQAIQEKRASSAFDLQGDILRRRK